MAKLTPIDERRLKAAQELQDWARRHNAIIFDDVEDLVSGKEVDGDGYWVSFGDGMTKGIYVRFEKPGEMEYLHRGKFQGPPNATKKPRRTRARNP